VELLDEFEAALSTGYPAGRGARARVPANRGIGGPRCSGVSCGRASSVERFSVGGPTEKRRAPPGRCRALLGHWASEYSPPRAGPASRPNLRGAATM
jgi:hypothetical protein